MTKPDVLLSMQRAHPELAAAALARFTSVNPHYRGAEWADCLEVLLDSDSHLEITEPIYEKAEVDAPALVRYVSAAAVTLYYATGVEPTWTQVYERAVVCAAVEAEDGS